MKRVVLTTVGSLGDLHPYLGIALELKSRGHAAVIATSAMYREKVESLGLGFHSIRPDFPDMSALAAMMPRVMDQRRGTFFIVRELLMPALRESYEDLMAAAERADLLVSHAISYAAPLVAETTGLPWASAMIAPIGFLSAYDPPVLGPAPLLSNLYSLGPRWMGPLFGSLKWIAASWSRPWHQLRAELGLPPTRVNPMFEGQHSPRLVLAIFSQLLAQKQPDWPPQTTITGFPFFDQHGLPGMAPGLAEFLDDGPPPIVFTLGSAAVLCAGRFYQHSAAAARMLGRRAVLLMGPDAVHRPIKLPAGVAAFDYAPFSQLFPRAAAIVHQGGAGTTGQAMRAGRPMLVMPFAHDQPDNAARVVRLGIARTISRRLCTPSRLAAELQELLQDPGYARRAAEVGKQVQQERGSTTACDALATVWQ